LSILITGGTGFIGLGLARRLVERGENVVLFDIAPRFELIADIKDKAKVIQGDLTVWSEVMNVVKENNVQGIFHLGAMLSETSESNPWASFQSNVLGTMHVLEAARLFGIKRVVFSSAVATFGPGRASDVITDETLQRPTTMYGIGKLFGELLGRFYRRRFDLDFRCLRYCAVIGPGAKSKALAQYNAWMIESATLGKAFECYVSEDTAIPVTYFKDAIRAAETLYDAPKEKIKTVCYNISGVSPVQTAKELELAIKKLIPEAKITYKPNALATEFIKGLNIKVIDDSRAREEWGWQPLYSNLHDVVADFINEVRTKPQFYGLT